MSGQERKPERAVSCVAGIPGGVALISRYGSVPKFRIARANQQHVGSGVGSVCGASSRPALLAVEHRHVLANRARRFATPPRRRTGRS